MEEKVCPPRLSSPCHVLLLVWESLGHCGLTIWSKFSNTAKLVAQLASLLQIHAVVASFLMPHPGHCVHAGQTGLVK